MQMMTMTVALFGYARTGVHVVEALKVRNDITCVPSEYSYFLLLYIQSFKASKPTQRYCCMPETVWYRCKFYMKQKRT